VDDRLRTRFEAKVDRSGRHHRWMGSRTADGAGKLKVDGRTVSARRVAWELERGPLSPTVPVNACPHDPACVRVEHLSFRGEAQTAGGRRRAARGTGSKTEVRQGMWKLTVTAGRYADGRVRRLHRTVRAGSEAAARRQLAGFVAEVREAPLPEHRKDREVNVDDAIEQFLTEHLLRVGVLKNIWASPTRDGRRSPSRTRRSGLRPAGSLPRRPTS
jgi:hypothetical protein